MAATALLTLTLLIVPTATPGPLVTGHRGAGADGSGSPYAENSLSSIVAAFEAGADLVEIDVQLDACGEVVLWHDAVISLPHDRFVPVRNLTRRALDRHKVYDGMPEHVPTLDEALYVALARPAPRRVLDIELKVYGPTDRGELLRAVLEVIDRHDAAGRVLISSSDLLVLRQLKAWRPEIEAGLIAPLPALDWRFFLAELDRGTRLEWFLPRRNLRLWAMYPEQLAQEAHRRGVKVGVWTVNEPHQIESFVAAGYDMIITDQPAVARRLISGDPNDSLDQPLREVLREARLVPDVLLPF